MLGNIVRTRVLSLVVPLVMCYQPKKPYYIPALNTKKKKWFANRPPSVSHSGAMAQLVRRNRTSARCNILKDQGRTGRSSGDCQHRSRLCPCFCGSCCLSMPCIWYCFLRVADLANLSLRWYRKGVTKSSWKWCTAFPMTCLFLRVAPASIHITLAKPT